MAESTSNHHKLRRAPLRRVICQLRFPTLLGFNAATVRPFQQAIEDEYPAVEVQKVVMGISIAGPQANPSQLDIKEVFRFTLLDGHTTVAVSEDFLSLETVQYDRFEQLAGRWDRVLRAAIDIFGLRRQARLGLRYTNVVEREEAGDVEGWDGLIADHLLVATRTTNGPIEATAFADQHVIRARTPNGGITFRYGFPTPPEEGLPLGYFIDFDNYDDEPKRIDPAHHLDRLTAWDDQSYALLRTSVTDTLWASFEPEGVR